MSRLHHRFEEMAALWDVARGRRRASFAKFRGRAWAQVYLGARFRMDRPGCVELGERSHVDDDVWFKIIEDDAKLRIGQFTFIGRET